MAPILALIVETLVEHVHNFVEVSGAAKCVSDTIAELEVELATYLLNVRAAISLISVPVGPHGSFDVAKSRISICRTE